MARDPLALAAFGQALAVQLLAAYTDAALWGQAPPPPEFSATATAVIADAIGRATGDEPLTAEETTAFLGGFLGAALEVTGALLRELHQGKEAMAERAAADLWARLRSGKN